MLRSLLLIAVGALMFAATVPEAGRSLSVREAHMLSGGWPNVNHPGTCCVDEGQCDYDEFLCADHFGNEAACSEDGHRRKMNPNDNKKFCVQPDTPGDVCLQSTEVHHCFAYYSCLFNWENGVCYAPENPTPIYNDVPDVCNGPC